MVEDWLNSSKREPRVFVAADSESRLTKKAIATLLKHRGAGLVGVTGNTADRESSGGVFEALAENYVLSACDELWPHGTGAERHSERYSTDVCSVGVWASPIGGGRRSLSAPRVRLPSEYPRRAPRRGRDPPRRPCNASSFLRRKSEPKLAGTGASTFHDVAVARAAYQQQWSDNRTEYFAYRPADKPPRPMIAPALCRALWYPTNSTVRYEPHAFGHPNTFRGDEAALSPT